MHVIECLAVCINGYAIQKYAGEIRIERSGVLEADLYILTAQQLIFGETSSYLE